MTTKSTQAKKSTAKSKAPAPQSSKTKFDRSASVEAKKILVELSRKAKATREEMIAKAQTELQAFAAASLTINEILLAMYQAQTGCKEFNTFLGWKEAGFKVKKGSEAFRIWGAPRVIKSGEPLPSDAPEGTTSDDGTGSEFWPTCCLFSDQQVEPIDGDKAPQKPHSEPALVVPVITATPTEKAPKKAIDGAKRAAKLRALGEGLGKKIDACFGDRLENTPKRLKQAANKRTEGYQLQRTQAALFALADLVDAGNAPAELDKINSVAAMFDLVSSKKTSVENGYHAYSRETGEPAKNSPEALAAWALLQPKTEEQKRAEKLKEKTSGLLFSSIPGFFPSPAPVVDEILSRVEIFAGDVVLDPNGGSGAILDAVAVAEPAATLKTYEINGTLSEILNLKGYDTTQCDFLSVEPYEMADKILMNPPFENLQDIAHIQHAFNFLKAGGRLVAVMSPSAFFRSDKKSAAFRAWFESLGGVADDLPEGSFKSSGTNVATKIIILDKPEKTGTDDDENPYTNADYESRIEQKKAGLSDRAIKASRESAALFDRTTKLGSVIPMGQPILVGHHSERRDRAFRNRLDNNFRKSFELSDKAGYLAGRAATVGTGGIASDDPEAVKKLKEKLATLEATQEKMKATNAALRKNDDKKLEALGYGVAMIEQLKKPDHVGRVGFADYQLTNNSAEIRRLKKRIEDLQTLYSEKPFEQETENYKIYISEGRIRIYFKFGKPAAEVRDYLHNRCSYNFSRFAGEWVRKATPSACAQVEALAERLAQFDPLY